MSTTLGSPPASSDMASTASSAEAYPEQRRRCTLADVGLSAAEEATPEDREDLEAYFRVFAVHRRDENGDCPCLNCGEPSARTFVWGLARGEGHCRNCGWPARLYHRLLDRKGEQLFRWHGLLLQYHPDEIEVRKSERVTP